MNKLSCALLALAAGTLISGCVTVHQAVASSISPVKVPVTVPVTMTDEHATEIGFEIRSELASLAEPHATPPKTTIVPVEKVATEKVATAIKPAVEPPKPATLHRLEALEKSSLQISQASETPLMFDIPVTYNERVKKWIRFFQTDGRLTFKNWLERSSRYIPVVQAELSHAGLPQDLVYVAMIESGFSPGSTSPAGARGMWQFIAPTARRYGLHIDWWIDERTDFHKATQAAIHYMSDLHQQFNSWYLVAASYNMGENGVRRLVQRHHTNNYWELLERGALPQETGDYVPKIIAAMLISKAPTLYGFRDLEYQLPLSFEMTRVPGGTDIVSLASYLGISEKYLRDLNPELIKGFIPTTIHSHLLRVPKGAVLAVSQFIQRQSRETNRTAANAVSGDELN